MDCLNPLSNLIRLNKKMRVSTLVIRTKVASILNYERLQFIVLI